MKAQRCQQRGCSGALEDGYCNVCGIAPEKNTAQIRARNDSGRYPANGATGSRAGLTGTGSSPVSRAARGSRRTQRSTSGSGRRQLGAGLITLPELPSSDPDKSVMLEQKVPENRRFCPNCNFGLRRETGFCGKCGRKYSFLATLNPGDMVAAQYEVRGALAFGGLGWIYLAFDRILSRYVVLKGLLNAHDEGSAATAVAERQFLAVVKHPNIVGIYNFVQQASEGFIVMEYVGGKTLKRIRQERGPLPPAEAIAYIHRILGAFTYLHNAGLVYCDFKPDNVMLERDDVKLIDMGGVRRIDDMRGDIYGTAGYSAPEAGEGPSVQSDLFTVGRTLAVLVSDISGFSSENKYKLPGPDELAVFAQHESLYRVLLKATASNPDDRFSSAEEMGAQLLGVLREEVAMETGVPRPSASAFFSGDSLAFESGDEMKPVKLDVRHLPLPVVDNADPGLQAVTAARTLQDPGKRVGALTSARANFRNSREIKFALAAALAEVGKEPEADRILKELGEEDPWDWRVEWNCGRAKLAAGKAQEAQKEFDQVYFDLPGETAPKLALAMAAEMAGNTPLAVHLYEIVSRVDDSFVSASFGLARCLHKKGDRKEAVEALNRIPQNSGLYLRSRVEAARLLISLDPATPAKQDLSLASAIADGAAIDNSHRVQLYSQILRTALDLVRKNKLAPDKSVVVLGCRLEETTLRVGLERALKAMAQLTTGAERIALVEQANQIRPLTLF